MPIFDVESTDWYNTTEAGTALAYPDPALQGQGVGTDLAAGGRALGLNTSAELGNVKRAIYKVSTLGGGTTARMTTIPSRQSGSLIVLGGASSGQTIGVPRPWPGMYFDFVKIADGSSRATNLQLPSTAYDFRVHGANISTGDLLTFSSAVGNEDGISFSIVAVSSLAYEVRYPFMTATTFAAAQSS